MIVFILILTIMARESVSCCSFKVTLLFFLQNVQNAIAKDKYFKFLSLSLCFDCHYRWPSQVFLANMMQEEFGHGWGHVQGSCE